MSQQPQNTQQTNPQYLTLPPNWSMSCDQTGRPFFFNQLTRETSWFPPSQQPQNLPPPPPPPTSKLPLPAGWEESFDPRVGKPFYIDHNTKKTTWVHPGLPQQSVLPTGVSSAVVPPQNANKPSQNTTATSQQQKLQTPTTAQPTNNWQGSVAAPQYQQYSPVVQQPQQYAPWPGAYAQPQIIPSTGSVYPPPQMTNPLLAYGVAPQPQGYAPSMFIQPQVIVQPEVRALCLKKPEFGNQPDQPNCPRCGIQYSMFKRRQQCSCCARKYCDTCASKKNPKDASQTHLCESCLNHLSKNEQKCMPRLVPYFTDPKEETKVTALQELIEMLDSPQKILTSSDLALSGCVDALIQLAATQNPSPLTNMTFTALHKIVYDMDNKDEVMKRISGIANSFKTLTEALNKHLSASPSALTNGKICSIITALIKANEQNRGNFITVNALKPAIKAMEEVDNEMSRKSSELVAALSTGISPCGDPTDESTAVFSLCAKLQATTDVTTAAFCLEALSNLCVRDTNAMAVNQADGEKAISSQLSSDNDQVRLNAIKLLSALSKQANICAKLTDSVGQIVTSVASTRPIPERQFAFLILQNLSNSDATQRTVNESLLLDNLPIFAGAIQSNDPALQGAALTILLSIISTHQEIAGGMIRESNLIEPLLSVARLKSPVSLQALRCVAMSCQNCNECGDMLVKLGVVDSTLALISMGGDAALEGAQALWCLTTIPAISAAFSSHPSALLAVASLLTPVQPQRLRISACGILANTPGSSLRAVMQHGALPLLGSMITSTDADMATHSLRAIATMCGADDANHTIVNAAVSTNIPSLISPLLRVPNPAIQFHAVSCMAEMCKAPSGRSVFAREVPALVTLAGSGRDVHIKGVVVSALSNFTMDEQGINLLRTSRGSAAFTELLFAEGKVKEHATQALSRLVDLASPDEIREMISLGAIMGLVEVAVDQAVDNDIVGAACSTLVSFLSRTEQAREFGEGASRAAIAALNRKIPQAVQLITSMANAIGAQFVDELTAAGGVNDLCTAAVGGDKTAVEAIAALTKVSPKVWDVCVEQSGPVGVVALAASNSDVIRRYSVRTICSATDHAELFPNLISAGAPKVIASMLAEADKDTVELAVVACTKFVQVPEARAQIVEVGGAVSLVELLSNPAPQIRTAVLTCISQLCLDAPSQKTVVEAKLLPRLIDLLYSSDADTKSLSANVLATLSADTTFTEMIFASGGITALSQFMAPETKSQDVISCFAILANGSKITAAQPILLSGDILGKLGEFLSAVSSSERESALKFLSALVNIQGFPQCAAECPKLLSALAEMLKMPSPPNAALDVVVSASRSVASRKLLTQAGCLESLPSLALAGNSRAMDALAYISLDNASRSALLPELVSQFLLAFVNPNLEDVQVQPLLRMFSSLLISETHRQQLLAADGFVSSLISHVKDHRDPQALRIIQTLAFEESLNTKVPEFIAEFMGLYEASTPEMFVALCSFFKHLPQKKLIAAQFKEKSGLFFTALKSTTSPVAFEQGVKLLKSLVYYDEAREVIIEFLSLESNLTEILANPATKVILSSLTELLGLGAF